MLIPKNTEEAHEIGEKLSREEALARWEEYKNSLSDLRLAEEMLKKSFREQMLRETVEGYLGASDHYSLTRDHIEMLLKKGGAMTHIYTRQADVLAYIKENEGVSQGRIRLHFGINPYTLLRKLRQVGLIRSERDENDRREMRYYGCDQD